jgi:hypothetical protein
MGKKDLQSVTASLASLAAQMPTQKPAAPASLVVPSAAPAGRNVQFSLDMRLELRKQLLRLAADADTTARAFVLMALKEKGLDVQPEDLIDRRKQRS